MPKLGRQLSLSSLPGSTLEAIPLGADGVRATLLRMAGIAEQAKVDLQIRMLAVSICALVEPKDYRAEVAKIQAWVQQNIRYTMDVDGVETLQNPVVTLQIAAGDCDDQSMLMAALCESVGHPARFVAVGATAGNYSHVYCEVQVDGQWLAAETTEAWPLGRQPVGVVSRMVQTV